MSVAFVCPFVRLSVCPSKVTRPINGDTHRPPYLPNLRPMNFKLGVQMEDDNPHQPQAP